MAELSRFVRVNIAFGKLRSRKARVKIGLRRVKIRQRRSLRSISVAEARKLSIINQWYGMVKVIQYVS